MKGDFNIERAEVGFEDKTFSENEKRILSEINLSPEVMIKLFSEPPFAEGSHAVLFELQAGGKDLVAKVGKDDNTNLNRGAKENVILRFLRIRGFKEAPRVHGYISSRNILFEEKIEGRPIKNFDERDILNLAEILAKLHSIKLDSYGKPLEKRELGTRMDCLYYGINTLRNLALTQEGDSKTIAEVKNLLDKITTEAEQVTEAFSKNIFTLIHFDLNPNNILRSDENMGIILVDWEQASVGDNAMDIAKFFLKCELNSKQRIMFLKKYESCLLETDPDFNQRLRIYEPLVLVNSVLWRLRTLSMSDDVNIKDEEFYERVRDGLKKDLIKIKALIEKYV